MADASKGTALRFLLGAAAFVVVIAGLRAAVQIVNPFLVASFLAIISIPAFNWLCRRRIPAAISLGILIFAVVVVGLVLISVVGRSVAEFTAQQSTYVKRLAVLKQDGLDLLEQLDIDPGPMIEEQILDETRIVEALRSLLGSMTSLMSNAFVIFLTYAFLLLEASVFEAKLQSILGAAVGGADDRLERIQESIRKYLVLKTFVSLLTGVLVGGWLSVLGIDFALLWALLAFLLNYIPNIGSIIAAIPAVLLALIQLGVADACWVAGGYAVVNIVIGNVVEPRIMGQGVGLSTLVVFLSLIFWGWVLGPFGMLLSVPLTMIVKIILEHNDQTRWIAVMLSSEPPQPVATGT